MKSLILWLFAPLAARMEQFMFRAGLALACVDAPDTKPMEAAAASSERIANRQMDMQESLIPYYKERQEKLDAMTTDVTNTQLGIMRQQADQGQDYFDYAKETFRPVEQSIVSQVMKDSTPQAYERYASAAAARTGTSFKNLQSAAERNARSMGVNPASRPGVNRAMMMDSAAASGAAFNGAYDAAETRSYARKLDAAGLGRNLPGASAAAYGGATAAGGAAAGAGNDASRTAASTIGTPGSYGQLANGAMGNAIGAYGSVINAPAGGIDPGLGMILGMAGSAAVTKSSKKLKVKKRAMSDDEVLGGIRRAPSEKWEYDPNNIADDGGAQHTGPYAEDMHREFGVGDGENLNPMDTAGVALRGVQALDNRLAGIEKALGIKRGGSDGARA